MRQVRSDAAEAHRQDPEAVHRALRHALLSHRPRPHYVVTLPARIGTVLKRLLPAALLYRILARNA
jgi:hypothetical protein